MPEGATGTLETEQLTAAWHGASQLLDEYANVSTGDRALILYTSDSVEPAAWASAALEARGVPVTREWMAPLHDPGFAARLDAVLPDPDQVEGRLVVLTFEKDTMSHTTTLAEGLRPFGPHRRVVLRAISSCAELFTTALSVTPDELTSRNASLLGRLMPAHMLRISTRSGSDLTVEVDSARHRWISNRGWSKPGGVVILPAGEVATYPAGISGTFVADFAFNVNAITDQDARLDRHPVTVHIEGGRAVDYQCDDPALRGFLDECFQSQCAVNVGELGFGTNAAISRPIAMNSHINERRPGVHLGFGQHNQDPGVVPYQCPIHLDLIATGGLVYVDDDPVPIDLEHVPATDAPHPDTSRDEDVFSPSVDELEVDDCCGILTSEGLCPFPSPT